jgi:hypothetical protein
VLRRILEPCQEIERFSKLAAVMQPSGYGRQVLQSDGDVPGALLEDGPAFVLGQIPPCTCFADGNERRPCGLYAGKSLFACAKGVEFGAARI